MKKRIVTATVAAALFMGSLAGCGGSSEPSAGSGSQASSSGSGSGKETITMWHALADNELEIFQKYVDEFNAQSKLAEVELVYTPADEYIKQLTIGNIAGDMADLVMMDNCYTSEFAASGVLEDLSSYYDEWDENQMLEGPMQSVIYEDGVYGLPYACNTIALFYNVDMLEEAGVEVPTTWEELVDAAEKLTTEEHTGFAFCGAKTGEGAFQVYPFLNQAGADINTLDSEGAIAAVEMRGSMVEAGSASKEVMNWSQADLEKQFAAGNVAMIIEGVWQIGQLREDAPDLNWDVAKIPIPADGKDATALGGENICVTSGANTEACWEFLSWICSKDVSPRLCKEMSRFSARSDVDNEEWFSDDPQTLFFANYMEYTVARVHPRWTECATAFEVAYQKVFSGEASAADAMAEAQAEIDEINAEE